jgi:hypothetical protein
MRPSDMTGDQERRRLPNEQVDLLWPQARGELLGFANALERGNSGITAAQIRMAVNLADEAIKLRERDMETIKILVMEAISGWIDGNVARVLKEAIKERLRNPENPSNTG